MRSNGGGVRRGCGDLLSSCDGVRWSPVASRLGVPLRCGARCGRSPDHGAAVDGWLLVDDGDREQVDGRAVVQGQELVVEEDDAPHEGGEPERGEIVGLVLADDDRVRHGQEADHGRVLDEVEHGLLVERELGRRDEVVDLRTEVLEEPDDGVEREVGLDLVEPRLRRDEARRGGNRALRFGGVGAVVRGGIVAGCRLGRRSVVRLGGSRCRRVWSPRITTRRRSLLGGCPGRRRLLLGARTWRGRRP
mmetsp:Transcript_11175/g.45261  ORF Transcript_11175/g.45261 Transcript_11175/m.45261 type:complete len:248 (-) Transcript_11175:148-891(-)